MTTHCACGEPAAFAPTVGSRPTPLCSRHYEMLLRNELIVTPGTQALLEALRAVLSQPQPCPDCGDPTTQAPCRACQEWGK